MYVVVSNWECTACFSCEADAGCRGGVAEIDDLPCYLLTLLVHVQCRLLVDDAFRVIDADKDGSISWDEFRTWAETQPVMRASVCDLEGNEISAEASILLK